VRTLTHRTANRSLAVLLYRLNPVLRGWCAYFRHGVSSHSFGYLEAYAWRRILRWLRRRHPHSNWKTLRRAFLPGWLPTQDGVVMVRPSTVRVSRYRYRGDHIPTPWATATGPTGKPAA
jgi:RNA-directed DNA polymerase